MNIGSHFIDSEGDTDEGDPVACFYVYKIRSTEKSTSLKEVEGHLILEGNTESISRLGSYKTAVYVPNGSQWIKILTFNSIPIYNHGKVIGDREGG